MAFTPRLTRPTTGNKYYITQAKGGYSQAIEGKVKATGKPDPQCNVLSNCVGYAYGRFNEIGGYNACKYLVPTNAENFPEHRTGMAIGTEPQLGAVIVWQKGATLSGSDGAGHVAVVEKIFDDGSILISQSGWNSSVFWTAVHRKGADGNWIEGDDYSWMKGNYKFRCFIYNPAVKESDFIITMIDLKKGSTSKALVKELQQQLNMAGNYGLAEDGSFGPATEAAVKDFQQKNKLAVDGIAGPATRTALKNLLTRPAGVDDLTIMVDGKPVTVWAINKNSQNYIRVADFTRAGLAKSVEWNAVTKKVEVKTR